MAGPIALDIEPRKPACGSSETSTFVSLTTKIRYLGILRAVHATTMQAANRLQKALRTGSGLSLGAWQMLPGSNISRLIARTGFDWVVVDSEHGNIDGDG